MNIVRYAVLLSVASALLSAQWLHYPTPGIPRTPDGKPNLSAPAPRTADGKPDLSGLWRPGAGAGAEISTVWTRIKAQPWARAVADKRNDEFLRDDPRLLCLPFGPWIDLPIRKVVQAPNLLMFVYEDLTYRQIFLDGRQLEPDPNPTWMGYSVGHWDKDTLVIESNGFNDRSWIGGGYPHTEALRMTERLRRIDFGHLELQRTLTDSKTLIEPLTLRIPLELDADTEMLEFVCNENERDREHVVGNVSDYVRNEVAVAPAILAGYTGTYTGKIMAGTIVTIVLKVSAGANGRLVFDGLGFSGQTLFAVSETRFVGSFGALEFIRNPQGAVSQLTLTIQQGDVTVDRMMDAK